VESFDAATTQGLAITNLFGLELVISALLLALVLAWMIAALIRFRARPGDATEPPQVHGHRIAEVVWTGIPVLVLAGVFLLVLETMRTVDASPPNAQMLRVIGHQWWWEFEYPELGVITANELYVPVGSSLQVELDSVDVIHSFHVPQFGWMRDTIPGKTNKMSFLVDRAGTYAGTCNQYCGAQHAWMRVIIQAQPMDQFTIWAMQQSQSVRATGTRGEQVYLQNTCVNCHTIRGLPSDARVGPDLTHLGSRGTLGGGVVSNTPANLRQWIRNPSSIKPGVLMPGFQNISDADLTALVDYLQSLR
jgi:cytochrome c oxidase subunit 2